MTLLVPSQDFLGHFASTQMKVNVRVDPFAEPLGNDHHSHPKVVPAQAGAVESKVASTAERQSPVSS